MNMFNYKILWRNPKGTWLDVTDSTRPDAPEQGDDLGQILNELGMDGWEVVATTGDSGEFSRVILKRQQ